MGGMHSIEYSVHLKDRPCPGPIHGRFTVAAMVKGYIDIDGVLHDSAGRLVAVSRQMAKFHGGLVQPGGAQTAKRKRPAAAPKRVKTPPALPPLPPRQPRQYPQIVPHPVRRMKAQCLRLRLRRPGRSLAAKFHGDAMLNAPTSPGTGQRRNKTCSKK